MGIVYTEAQYKHICAHVVGSIVGMGAHRPKGRGIVLDTRFWRNKHIHFKIAWFQTPYENFTREREIGWHSYESVWVIYKARQPI